MLSSDIQSWIVKPSSLQIPRFLPIFRLHEITLEPHTNILDLLRFRNFWRNMGWWCLCYNKKKEKVETPELYIYAQVCVQVLSVIAISLHCWHLHVSDHCLQIKSSESRSSSLSLSSNCYFSHMSNTL